MLLAHSVYQVEFSLCHHDDNGELGRRRDDSGDRPCEPLAGLRGGGEWQGRRQLAHLGHHHHLVHLGQRQESTSISSEAKAAHREVVQYRDLSLLQKVSQQKCKLSQQLNMIAKVDTISDAQRTGWNLAASNMSQPAQVATELLTDSSNSSSPRWLSWSTWSALP